MKFHQTLALSVVLAGCPMAAAAQTPMSALPAAEASPNLRLVRTMESLLSTAVQNGVDQLALKISKVAPGLRLFNGQPRAHGYQLEDMGWFFDVEIPDIYPGTADLYIEMLPTRPDQRQVNSSGTNAVAPTIDLSMIVRDPQGEYRLSIREALIDAMLDFGQMPLKPNESLTIGARRPDPVGPSAAGDSSVALVLSIKGEDLTALRAGKITREEAKARIKIREDQR